MTTVIDPEILPTDICLKITNEIETHFGFKYVDGLNILVSEFNDDPNVKCGSGGFYFTTKKHIQKFYSFGIYLREISIPITDPEFKILKCKDNTKWRCNKIILGTKHSLFDPETYVKFGLDIWQNKHIIVFACKYGKLDFLEKLKSMDINWNKKYPKNTINQMIIAASKYRQIAVLDWLKKENIIYYSDNKYDYDYDEEEEEKVVIQSVSNILNNVIDSACKNGYLDIIQWWEKIYSSASNQLYVQYALRYKQFHILDWLIKHKAKYTDNHFIIAADNTKDIAILQYWLDNNLVQNNINAYCYTFVGDSDNFKEILEFLHKNNLIDPSLLSEGLVRCKNENVFELVKNLGIKINLEKIMDAASSLGNINILEWAKNSGLDLTYSSMALHVASRGSKIDVLDWWKNSGLELKYNDNILTDVIYYSKVFNWWVDFLQIDGKIDIKYLKRNETDINYDFNEELEGLEGCG